MTSGGDGMHRVGPWSSRARWTNQNALVAILAMAGICTHLILRYLSGLASSFANLPLLVVLLLGGAPMVIRLVWRGLHGQFGSDHLAGISIIASVLLDEYLAGAIVVLMLSGGEALEQFAVTEATSVSVAHRKVKYCHVSGSIGNSRFSSLVTSAGERIRRRADMGQGLDASTRVRATACSAAATPCPLTSSR